MPAMVSVTIKVSFAPRTVEIAAVSAEDNEEYSYSGQTRRASKRLREILDKVAATYDGPDDSFEQNVTTDGSLMLLPGP